MLHRIRRRLVQERTGLVNQIRGLLLEYGIALRKGIGEVRRVLEDASNELTVFGRELIDEHYDELCTLDRRLHKRRGDALAFSVPPAVVGQ